MVTTVTSLFHIHLDGYPKTFREIEALDELETVEQRLLQEARRIFGGQIFTEEFFNKHYKIRKVRRNGKKQRI